MKLHNEVEYKVETKPSEHTKFIKAISETMTGATTL